MNTNAPRIVYLDLNHWYALGEAAAGRPRQPNHVNVLQQLTKLVKQNQVMCPLSAIHYMELTENPRDNLRAEAAAVMAKLSRFNTITSTSRIVDEELALALNRKFGRPAFPTKVKKFGFGAGFAFGEPKTLTLKGGTEEDRKEFEAKLGKSIAEWEAEVSIFAEYFLLAGPETAIESQIPNYERYVARRIADDELESFNVMLQTLRTNADIASRPLEAICARQFTFEFFDNYKRTLESAGFVGYRRPFYDKKGATDFLMSLPSRRVASMMQFHYLKDVHRDWKINDLRDIAALAISIPYCDVVVTDKKACDTAVKRAHLDQEFNTVVLCQLTDLAAHLST